MTIDHLLKVDPSLRAVLAAIVGGAHQRARARRGRAAHDVGISALGTLRVVEAPEIPPHRVFAAGQSYSVLLRHSNARGFADDAVLDGRGAALRLLERGPGKAPTADELGDTLLDLVLVTGRRFIARDAATFARWGAASAAERAEMMAATPAIAEALAELIRDPDSYAALHYHSQTTYRFVDTAGVAQHARYRLIPADRRPDSGYVQPSQLQLPLDYAPRRPDDGRAQSYLRDEMRARIEAGSARYLLQLQLRAIENGDDALDPTQPWPDAQWPWRDVAEIALERVVDAALGESVQYNVANAPPELGLIPARSATDPASVNHARAITYEVSGRARLGIPLTTELARLVAESARDESVATRHDELRQALIAATLSIHHRQLPWTRGAPRVSIPAALRESGLRNRPDVLRRVIDRFVAEVEPGRWSTSGEIPAGFQDMMRRLTRAFDRAEAGDMHDMQNVLLAYRPVCMETIYWNGVLTCQFYRDHREYLAYAERVTRVLPAESSTPVVLRIAPDTILVVARFASVEDSTGAVVLSEYASVARLEDERWALHAVLETGYHEVSTPGGAAALAVVNDFLARVPSGDERDFKLCLAIAAGLLVDEWAAALTGDEAPRTAAGGARRVCVIGAGPAGLMAARELERRGHVVTVLERADTIAGKCGSVDVNDRWYDLGGHLCIGDHLYLRTLADEVSAPIELATPSHVFDLDAGAVVPQRGLFFDRDALRRYQELRDGHFPEIADVGLAATGRALASPAGEWIVANEFGALAAVGYAYTGSGYGFLDAVDLPVLYPLRFAELSGAFSLDFSPGRQTRWTIAGGMMELWRRVTRELRDVRLGTRVERVERRDGRVRVQTRDETLEFDDLVLAMPLDRALPFLDASDDERDLFERIRYVDYYTTVATARGLPRLGFYLLKQHAESAASAGHCVSLHHRYADTDVYTFYSYGSPDGSAADVQRLLREDVARMGGQIEAIHTQRRWAYMPHVSSSDLADGFFERVEALQGRRNTYYAGSLLAFELIEPTIVHARHLVERSFAPVGNATSVRSTTVAPISTAVANATARPTRSAPGAISAEQIRDWMVGQIARRLGIPANAVDPATPLETYPLESLAIVGMIAELSDWLDWQVTPAVIIEYPTIAEIAQQLAAEIAAADAEEAEPRPEPAPVAAARTGSVFGRMRRVIGRG